MKNDDDNNGDNISEHESIPEEGSALDETESPLKNEKDNDGEKT